MSTRSGSMAAAMEQVKPSLALVAILGEALKHIADFVGDFFG
jgi:hypothetical protein